MGISSYPATYMIRLEIGDVPSAIDGYAATGDKDSVSILSTPPTYTN